MLVAGASLSLLAPVAAQASDVVNLEEMNSYARSRTKSSRLDSKTFINEVSEDIAKLKGRVDGLEVKQKQFEAGGFSDTTVMDQKVVFDLGAIDLSETDGSDEAAKFAYSYRANLNTSFTGDDNLYIRLKTGNATDWQKAYTFGTYLSSSKGNSDEVKVDKIWYSFAAGNNTFWVGPQIENYYMHGTTPSIYKPVLKQFTLGGNGAAYGASTSPGLGWAYKADNGFAISSNFTTKNGDTSTGILTREGDTSWATQIGYTQPTYSASIILNQKYNGWEDSYYTTPLGKARSSEADSSNIGLRGWWRPDDSGTAVPSISLGYDTSSVDGQDQDTDAYFVGLTWQDAFTPDDRIGLAFGQPQTRSDETVDPFAWELYYSYKMNDSVSVTPAIFGSSDRNGRTDDADKEENVLGAVVETTFKF